MPARANVYRKYDVRTKGLIALSRNPRLCSDQNIPRSTARYWASSSLLRQLPGDVDQALEIETMKAEVKRLKALLKLLQSAAELAGNSISWRRFPEEEKKKKFLLLLEDAKRDIPLHECLGVVGLSTSRYTSWKARALKCELNDRSSCPRILSKRLTAREVDIMSRLYQDPNLKHLSLASLALYAQRSGKLHCSARTWSKYSRALAWDRKRLRLYPSRTKTGIRATAPNELWHIDVTQIRLTTGEKLYVQAVIDNYSRYVLAWRVTDGMGGMNTRKTIQLALKNAAQLTRALRPPTVLSDAGFENVNSNVGSLVRKGKIRHTIAQVDISFSNSMIEALFNALKNRYLYQHALTSVETLERAVDFYLNEHNERIPQQVLGGAKPREIFQNSWTQARALSLKRQAEAARVTRARQNRDSSCGACPATPKTA